jgi:catalase
MFYRSLSAVEQAHIVEAFTFELGKCFEQAIKERELQVLANVDADLCAAVAAGLGLPAPSGSPADGGPLSPALSQIVSVPGPITGRRIAVLADSGSDLAGIEKLRTAAVAQGATVYVLAATGGFLGDGKKKVVVDRTLLTSRSIEFDALVVAGGTTPSTDIKLAIFIQEMLRHRKALAAWGDGAAGLLAAGVDLTLPGIVVGDSVGKQFDRELFAAIGLHRAWAREDAVMQSAVAPSVPPSPSAG